MAHPGLRWARIGTTDVPGRRIGALLDEGHVASLNKSNPTNQHQQPASNQDIYGDSQAPIFPSIPKNVNHLQLIDLITMMNIAQHKGQPQDQSASPATVSTPRAVVRKSPSPLPARHVQERKPERSCSPVRKSQPTTRSVIVSKTLTVRHALDLHTHLDLLIDGRIHHWTSRRTSRWMMRKRHLVFPMEKMKEVPGTCLLHNMHSSVTSSKGAFKIVPARTKGAARASLLDLGEKEKTDKVSWMDQPSLLDTMASPLQKIGAL